MKNNKKLTEYLAVAVTLSLVVLGGLFSDRFGIDPGYDLLLGVVLGIGYLAFHHNFIENLLEDDDDSGDSPN